MKHLTTLIQSKFDEIQKSGKLFRVALTGQQIWDLYLGNFPKGEDPIFRDPTSSSHNCNHCKNFIRRYGNIIALDSDFRIVTMFDIDLEDEEYSPSMKAMADAIKASTIESVFFETYAELQSLPYEACKPTNSKFRLGIDKNTKMYTKAEADMYGGVETDKVYTFNHFHLDIPKAYVDSTGKSVEAIMGGFRDPKNVLKRGLDELPLDTLELVRDLIHQGSLLDGQTHLYKVEGFITLKKEYDKLSAEVKDNWCWIKSQEVPFAKFKGELIGVLCTDLAEGKGLNESCMLWNKRADPVNYMKVTAPYTEKQRKEASDLIEKEGYTESFSRRFATLEDIKISEILHANAGDGKVKSLSILDGMKSPSTRHKKSEFNGIEEVSIDKFMSDILPNATSVEVYLESRLESNMVSLTTSCNPDSKPMFKWNNNYSWTFNGNLAGKSEIKEAVKLAGGDIEGVLNFRLAWNNEGGVDNSDLDAWAIEPSGERIGFSTNYRASRGGRSPMSGQLDLDVTDPRGKLAVENITWNDKRKMKDGEYKLYVNQYSHRNSKGFKAEIEFDGEIYCYDYNQALPNKSNVNVAIVTLKNGVFSIKHLLPEVGSSSKEIYGLDTNTFHKVNLMCLSPNHWGENEVGNKFFMFMLDKCKAPGKIRTFHSENLNADLTTIRKVLEPFGVHSMIESTEPQLSGLGFNATVRDEVVVKVSGSFKRTLKIKF